MRVKWLKLVGFCDKCVKAVELPARFYVWIFGAILMVTLGVIAVLPLLKEWSQWAFIIALFLYFVAALVMLHCDRLRLSDKTP